MSEVHVSYGLMETDEDATPVGVVHYSWDGRPFVVWKRPIRRKVFETWIENGQKIGRWHWRYL